MQGELAMSASNETMPPPPPPEEMAKVWEIHKDADATLHSRVNVFVSTQAFLFAGFAAFLALDLEENKRNHLLLVVFVVGVMSALVFMYSQNRILTGIEYLKNQYLLEHDKIYSDYYWAKEKVRKPAYTNPKPVKYRVARGVPWAFLLLWVVVYGFGAENIVTRYSGYPGSNDAKENRPGYGWSIYASTSHNRSAGREAWRVDIGLATH